MPSTAPLRTALPGASSRYHLSWYPRGEERIYQGIAAGAALAAESLNTRYLFCIHWGIWGLISMGSELQPANTLEVFPALYFWAVRERTSIRNAALAPL